MIEKLAQDLIEAGSALVSAIAPAALGSAVAQAYQKGLGWRDRLVQWTVGVCVSYFVTSAVAALLGLNPFVAQGVGFVLGMIAFQATPKFISSASDTIASLPAAIRDFLLRRKGQ